MTRPDDTEQNMWPEDVDLWARQSAINLIAKHSTFGNALYIFVARGLMEAQAEQREKDAEICLTVFLDIVFEFPNNTHVALGVVKNALLVAANKIEKS